MAKRASGVLLHVTSLPGAHGIGDLGREALALLDWLARAGQSLWQILPLGPVGPGFSPYDAQSSFAGNPLLIDLEALVDVGLLERSEVDDAVQTLASDPSFERVRAIKEDLLRRAWQHLTKGNSNGSLACDLQDWSTAREQQSWLSDWCLYSALKRQFNGQSWIDWPPPLRHRQPEAVAASRHELEPEILFQQFLQFLFFDQFGRLRKRAHELGIELVGDLPFYVALDSCDVWAHPELFDLDPTGRPRTIGGVPPDYFSATGQRWGNPIYLWQRHHEQGFQWWIDRIAFQLRTVDHLRLDHFRGFVAFWAIPAAEPTAVAGHWQASPGRVLFDALDERLGELPLVAEDLGLITPEVEALRRQLHLPGMRVLQFAFDSHDSEHLPHNLTRDRVLYTGTHDNDTSRGWFEKAGDEPKARALEYLGATPSSFCWDLLRAAQTSVADWVIAPVQDMLGLDGSHRMNTPGTVGDNWRWRLPEGALTAEISDPLRRLVEVSGRLSETQAEAGDHS